MNFLGVGPLELIVILVVALVVVGPERLPRLAADIARTIREIRRYTGQFAAEFNEVIQELEAETSDDRAQWKEIGQGMADAAKPIGEALSGADADARSGGSASPAASGGAKIESPPQAAPPADSPDAGTEPLVPSANGSAGPAAADARPEEVPR